MTEPIHRPAAPTPVPNGHAPDDNDPVPNEIRRDWAIEDVSLEVKPGQLAAIVGRAAPARRPSRT